MSAVCQETENYYRGCSIILDLCTAALREVLEYLHPAITCPPSIPPSKKVTLAKEQKRIVANISTTGSYDECDISLLYILFRNIAPKLFKPTNGWGITPIRPTAVSSADDVERIRLLRNNIYGHVSAARMDTPSYNKMVAEVNHVMQRLDAGYHGYVTII